MTKIPNQIDFIEFPAMNPESLARAKAFYAAAFGWSFKDWGEDYVDTASSGLGCGFNADPEHRPDGKPLVVIYAADLPAMLVKVVASGGRITKEIFSFPGGRRFHFQDPSGNDLAVWSDQ